jgi:fatty acid desaturase
LESIGRLSGVFWAVCVGVVGLYVFFLALGAYSAGELIAVTIVMAVLVVLLFVHFARVRHHIDEDLEFRRKVNAFRETRGF